eukprot:TRINITY_DN4940_c0_g1_i1.p1 TRINITY_DN4940_c0_g1~~TRINITY_DN4940_c0_g1_i1.p1  ORF type:complete len:519 (+),score=150.90 TRINITY_DN4940_c0_g1_i1:83-1639(+)
MSACCPAAEAARRNSMPEPRCCADIALEGAALAGLSPSAISELLAQVAARGPVSAHDALQHLSELSASAARIAELSSKGGGAASFHRRELPCPPAVSFAGEEGRRLFREALAAGTAEGGFRLLETFHTQDEPAYCGLATLVTVLNALNVDPGRQWKGVWRWFSEELLDCCEPLHVVRQKGITLPRFVCLARCNGLCVDLYRPSDEGQSEGAFRDAVIAACSSATGDVVVAAYSRKQFKQTGDGHYSPIGAYHRERDLILVLDVARFKYPPHWVPLTEMWKAMQRADPDTGSERGYCVMRRKVQQERRCALALHFSSQAWDGMRAALHDAPDRIRAAARVAGGKLSVAGAAALIHLASREECGREDLCADREADRAASATAPEQAHGGAAPADDGALPRVLPSVDSCLFCSEGPPSPASGDGQSEAQLIWAQLQQTAKAIGVHGPDAAQRVAVILAIPPDLWLPPDVVPEEEARLLAVEAMPAELGREVAALRIRVRQIVDSVDGHAPPRAAGPCGGCG